MRWIGTEEGHVVNAVGWRTHTSDSGRCVPGQDVPVCGASPVSQTPVESVVSTALGPPQAWLLWLRLSATNRIPFLLLADFTSQC
ncbi:hypothetical protein JZ751_002359 [Albula glossodonta]|uniref:Uncharacterized protein n=1 Tax=Albula glossodonta TaxID=121402 RepID=A0A8T2PBM6_9TELE|nr:hypothetical protein JZ751_002359 [Albula glossodonta]